MVVIVIAGNERGRRGGGEREMVRMRVIARQRETESGKDKIDKERGEQERRVQIRTFSSLSMASNMSMSFSENCSTRMSNPIFSFSVIVPVCI